MADRKERPWPTTKRAARQSVINIVAERISAGLFNVVALDEPSMAGQYYLAVNLQPHVDSDRLAGYLRDRLPYPVTVFVRPPGGWGSPLGPRVIIRQRKEPTP